MYTVYMYTIGSGTGRGYLWNWEGVPVELGGGTCGTGRGAHPTKIEKLR